MRLKQHMTRWSIPPAKTAKFALSYAQRVSQFYFSRAVAAVKALPDHVVYNTLFFQISFLFFRRTAKLLGLYGAFSMEGGLNFRPLLQFQHIGETAFGDLISS